MSSKAAGAGDMRPKKVFKRVGKKVIIATIAIFDAGKVAPSQTPTSGASAIIGTAFDAIAKGKRPSAIQGSRTASTATTIPTLTPITTVSYTHLDVYKRQPLLFVSTLFFP